MKSIIFWLAMVAIGTVTAEAATLIPFDVMDVYNTCYDFQYAESQEDYTKAEVFFTLLDNYGYSLTHPQCVEGRIDALDRHLYEQRQFAKALMLTK